MSQRVSVQYNQAVSVAWTPKYSPSLINTTLTTGKPTHCGKKKPQARYFDPLLTLALVTGTEQKRHSVYTKRAEPMQTVHIPGYQGNSPLSQIVQFRFKNGLHLFNHITCSPRILCLCWSYYIVHGLFLLVLKSSTCWQFSVRSIGWKVDRRLARQIYFGIQVTLCTAILLFVF